MYFFLMFKAEEKAAQIEIRERSDNWRRSVMKEIEKDGTRGTGGWVALEQEGAMEIKTDVSVMSLVEKVQLRLKTMDLQ